MGKNLSEEAKKRRTSDLYGDGDWSQRDDLPTGDPIGDIVEEEMSRKMSAAHNRWRLDQENYEKMMRKQLIHPYGKHFGIDYAYPEVNKPKCDCGVEKSYKNPTLKMHSSWCSLRGGNES